MKGNFFPADKSDYKNTRVNIFLNGEMLQVFTLRPGLKQICSLSPVQKFKKKK